MSSREQLLQKEIQSHRSTIKTLEGIAKKLRDVVRVVQPDANANGSPQQMIEEAKTTATHFERMIALLESGSDGDIEEHLSLADDVPYSFLSEYTLIFDASQLLVELGHLYESSTNAFDRAERLYDALVHE